MFVAITLPRALTRNFVDATEQDKSDFVHGSIETLTAAAIYMYLPSQQTLRTRWVKMIILHQGGTFDSPDDDSVEDSFFISQSIMVELCGRKCSN